MTEYFVESWPPADPHERTRSDCKSWREADALALALAREGDNAVVLRVETSYMAEPADEPAVNGVRPGVDFPATLNAPASFSGGIFSGGTASGASLSGGAS